MKKTILVFALFLSACGGSGGSNGSNVSEYTDKYLFEEQVNQNRCTTEARVFTSNSAEETKRKICEALRDDKLNNNCAQASRRDLFDEKCSGYSWNQDEDQEMKAMVGSTDSLTWLTLTNSDGISDFCAKVKFPEQGDGYSSFSSKDDGLDITCDNDNGYARLMFCSGKGCELSPNTKITLKSSTTVDSFRRIEYNIVLTGADAKILFASMKDFSKQQFASSSDEQTRVKLKCTELSCAIDILLYTH